MGNNELQTGTRDYGVPTKEPKLDKWEKPSYRRELQLPTFDLEDALCAQTDPELFFPDVGMSNALAKKICGACPVQAECLEWALTNGEDYGIWGGLTAKERYRLKGPREAKGRGRPRTYKAIPLRQEKR